MPDASVHRELVLPNPRGSHELRPASKATLTVASPHPSWLEIHHRTDGTLRYHLGAAGATELAHTLRCLAEVYPGLELGAPSLFPFRTISRTDTRLLRALPNGKHHYWPMRLLHDSDRVGLLLQAISARELLGHELLLQFLFRRVPFWEQGLLTPSYPRFLAEKVRGHDRNLLPVLLRRRAEPAYHVEIRTAIRGPTDRHAEEALLGWLRSWTSVHGNLWWNLRPVAGRARPAFLSAFRAHDMTRFAARKSRRDLSATELAQVLPIPWREHHAGLVYAGAPAAIAAPSASVARALPSYASQGGIEVGTAGDGEVHLPPGWHHLAILGKTRTGKSTLALNVACQILAQEPSARVVVLEPTGTLIQALVERIPLAVAEDAVEIDPSHPTTEREGQQLANVPLNLLHLRGRREIGASEFERRAERVAGDLFQAIRNAWGEESIGGRAEFVLRAVLQGLLAVEGTNLVDAYSALSDRKVLQRLERLASGAQLKHALRVHLPKLDYSFTISSLDKVGKVATNPLLRKALCQRYHVTSFDRLLRHRLLLLNLAKGALGTEASTFLGAVLLSQLWSAVQERPPAERGPIYLVVDEFHNFAIPAFADMLSEGARLGLHVVAITQYLDRIPPKVRSALVGNVDAWAFFAVGPEDAKAAWEIAQGAKFGWRPEHFSGGLRPHQAALVTRDSLVRVDTEPARPPSLHSDRNGEAIRASVRRYSHPEDSEVSPLQQTDEGIKVLLRTLRGLENGRWVQWQESPVGPSAELHATVALCEAFEDVKREGDDLLLTSRGEIHLSALEVARNERSPHSDLLADGIAPLRDLDARVADQGPLLSRPDGDFEWNGQTYNIEVETTNLAKHPEQIVRNLWKAVAAGMSVPQILTPSLPEIMAPHFLLGGVAPRDRDVLPDLLLPTFGRKPCARSNEASRDPRSTPSGPDPS